MDSSTDVLVEPLSTDTFVVVWCLCGAMSVDRTIPKAFWFLVACVDHLQPPNYYTPSLLGSVVDQRVLLDLVQDKMPTLHTHLQKLEVDLSLFTRSWFLTVFVDEA
uniref:Rab-GAP TBC domain-containing protein n=1 Tax=Globodera rostochiensis TaxID=31243 RepID=A0A914HGM1_GLORO